MNPANLTAAERDTILAALILLQNDAEQQAKSALAAQKGGK